MRLLRFLDLLLPGLVHFFLAKLAHFAESGGFLQGTLFEVLGGANEAMWTIFRVSVNIWKVSGNTKGLIIFRLGRSIASKASAGVLPCASHS